MIGESSSARFANMHIAWTFKKDAKHYRVKDAKRIAQF